MQRLISFGASTTAGEGVGKDENYTSLLSRQLSCKEINLGKGGSSNLEILHNILNFEFSNDDIVIVMWTEYMRDTIFHENVSHNIGAWSKDKLAKTWLSLHTPYDMLVRNWMYINHADLFLREKQLCFCHLFQSQLKKPAFVDLKGPVINLEDTLKIDLGDDKLHPGIKSHTAVYELLRDMLCK